LLCSAGAPRLGHERLVYREVDLADVSAATPVTDEVAARYPVRYLVNNAGANRPAMLDQATTRDLGYSFVLNVRARYPDQRIGLPGCVRLHSGAS
jgi:short-subunit dehydrogenase